ncbi:MAG: nitroreductase family protein [Bacteroidales bacterium]|nr:nitroreductase family protein [Bacteroidales bacterium]
MAIPTSRTTEVANITINDEMCTICGNCVEVCKDFSIDIINKKLVTTSDPVFGCVGCGHCMAVCPIGAITISGREISESNLFEIPELTSASNYDQYTALLKRRRSIREFANKEVSRDIIDKIIDAATNSPMGIPPSDVNVLVLEGRDAVNAFAHDFCRFLNSMQWFVSKWFLTLMRPFWGKANDQMFRKFLRPMFNIFTSKMDENINLVTYDAPLAIYFYGSPYTDPADPIIAATVAMYAAETLGLGTCMIGSVHPLIQNGKKAKIFRDKYGIKFTSREGLIVLFGYPAVKYKKGIKRTFASVTTIN